uniref:CSON004493 protein n=1 Tax=Culicoides sonorensis TaxID=179676 RepID=A0A336L7M9_CULSO
MEYSLHVFEKLHEKQQKGEGTDCSFIFNQQDDNETESTPKVIHAHKMILSLASSYFETAFKEEWNGNKPILITTFESSLFEKLINSIYLNKIDFTDLDEGLNLYEAAHFYGIQMILDALQHKIQEICYETNVTKIKRLYELAEKFENYRLMEFTRKYFSLMATKILGNEEFYTWTPKMINSLSCPVKAMTYSINKFQLDMDQLPSFIPVIDQQIYFYARSFNLNNDGSEENYLIVKRTNVGIICSSCHKNLLNVA